VAFLDYSEPNPLFLTEAEIASNVGLGSLEWSAAAAVLEKSGLPRPDLLFGNRRYWPAVKAFLDRRAGMGHAWSLTVDGEEHWENDGLRSRARRQPTT
jgi:hypothetical protein